MTSPREDTPPLVKSGSEPFEIAQSASTVLREIVRLAGMLHERWRIIALAFFAVSFRAHAELRGQIGTTAASRSLTEQRQQLLYQDSLRRGTNFLISRQNNALDVRPPSVVTRTTPPAATVPLAGADAEADGSESPESLSAPRELETDCPECDATAPTFLGFQRPEWLEGEWPLQGEGSPRFNGWGRPLMTSSWRNRPWGASWFAGGIWGTGLMRNRVDQGSGYLAGFRLGWDFDHYMGSEMRLGFGGMGIHYAPDNELAAGESGTILWDLNLLYYPWGDSQVRPYALIGLGLASFNFDDDQDNRVNQQVMGLPFGFGVKYHWSDRLVLRAEFLDNVAFGSGGGLENMNNVSLTAGVEYRFGGHRRSYWPWNPSRWLTF